MIHLLDGNSSKGSLDLHEISMRKYYSNKEDVATFVESFLKIVDLAKISQWTMSMKPGVFADCSVILVTTSSWVDLSEKTSEELIGLENI